MNDQLLSCTALRLIVSKLRALCPTSPANIRSIPIQLRALSTLKKIFLRICEIKKSGKGIPRSECDEILGEAFVCLNAFILVKKHTENLPVEISKKLVDVIKVFLYNETPADVSIDDTLEVFSLLLSENDCRVRYEMSEAIKVMFDIFPSHVEIYKDLSRCLPNGKEFVVFS